MGCSTWRWKISMLSHGAGPSLWHLDGGRTGVEPPVLVEVVFQQLIYPSASPYPIRLFTFGINFLSSTSCGSKRFPLWPLWLSHLHLPIHKFLPLFVCDPVEVCQALMKMCTLTLWEQILIKLPTPSFFVFSLKSPCTFPTNYALNSYSYHLGAFKSTDLQLHL